MKTLILMRHGKAEVGLHGMKDFDRKLQNKGREQIPVMAHWLREQQIMPDQIICSSAARTMETAYGMAKQLSFLVQKIESHPDLYLAPPSVYESYLLSANNTVNTLMLFGHNPGISEFGMQLLPGFYEELPTAGILVTRSETPDWASWFSYDTRFVTYQIPKRLL